jgi:signal peptidase I
MLRLLKVKGHSLAPDFQEGDFVVIIKIPLLWFKLHPGDIVVFCHPEYGVMIKKVESFSQDGESIFVIGTHPDSVDSRRFGAIPFQDLLGKVIWHVRKPGVV